MVPAPMMWVRVTDSAISSGDDPNRFARLTEKTPTGTMFTRVKIIRVSDPAKPAVQAAADMLGFDVLGIANGVQAILV